MNKKIILRLKGGLGNQLFIYAFGYYLSREHSADLKLDYLSGFIRDKKYKRKYFLTNFKLSAKKATYIEMLFPFERLKRFVLKFHNYFLKDKNKYYYIEKNKNFDISNLKIDSKKNCIYIDGLWQCEKYFSKYYKEIFNEFQLDNQLIHKFKKSKIFIDISSCDQSVFIHLRNFKETTNVDEDNIGKEYYQKAIKKISSIIINPKFFIFSDSYNYANKFFKKELTLKNFELVNTSSFNEDLLDFWLMQNCKNAIIANSTFGWWAAWLSYNHFKGYVLFPSQKNFNNENLWNVEGQNLSSWLPVNVN